MPYVTSVERIAEARGEARGEARSQSLAEARGGASVLLEALGKLCGPLPESLEQQVRQLSIARLKELGKMLFDFRSLRDLQAWLESHKDL